MHVVLGYIVKINRVVTVDYTNVWCPTSPNKIPKAVF